MADRQVLVREAIMDRMLQIIQELATGSVRVGTVRVVPQTVYDNARALLTQLDGGN